MQLYWLLYAPPRPCYVTIMLRVFKFYLPAMPSPSPLPHYQNKDLPAIFSDSPPCYIIPSFDAQTHLGSKSIILI
jgi:hypothetical protein